ncbi:MAG: bifunctional diaminohydroxyphosphoribosylaminopyrimidine deaminase/5-amino-6-(5-phosphoribosylamino)uracil reductase RibD [Calditrichaceae bacterium]|nr:bifunctional diaminohydroxyphosphoribosylaminopyrimidine deaminase/5-amino-6-(5-phosphoribosylamino)uracil reductase RibD [Calditrichaceae bacterium]
MNTRQNIKYIKRCFNLALKGRGWVSPNPMVGAVIVKNGKAISEGWHKKYGQAHAEVMALQKAKQDVSGSTLYVNLEPCCHTNKNTPPCVPLIISKKIKCVVISNEDPNPQISGKGVKQLRDAGIEVITGICSEEGYELNRFFFNYMKSGLPYVTLKIAQSMDGKIGLSNQEQTWLTGEESRKFVHQMRAQYDAVMIGSNTVKVDNSKLTVREVKGRNPIKIIMDGKLSVPENSKIFRTAHTGSIIIFCDKTNDSKKIKLLENRGVEIIQLKSKRTGLLNLPEVLKILAKRKIISLFVEGGQTIFSQFLEENQFNEITILQAPVMLGEGISAFTKAYKNKLYVKRIEPLGRDVKIILQKL